MHVGYLLHTLNHKAGKSFIYIKNRKYRITVRFVISVTGYVILKQPQHYLIIVPEQILSATIQACFLKTTFKMSKN